MLAERVKKVAPSLTLAISAKAKEMKKQGIDVIGFGAGEPDFNTPENIKEAGIKAIKDNITRYTPASGMVELKEAIVEKFKKDNGLNYSVENIVVSCGAKHSLYNIFMAILNPGDEVIIFSPYWVSYPEMVRLADGVPVFVDLNEDNNFEIDFEILKEKITKKTKAIILNSPSNPTGSIFSKATIEKLAEIALKNNVLLISDEIYEKIIYDGEKHISIASISDEVKKNTIVVNGVSKTYAMTGWRIGYIAADNIDIVKAINKIQSHSTSNPTSIAQVASIEALKTDESIIQNMVDEFNKRRKYIMERIKEIEGLDCVEPRGAFYVFPTFKKLIGKEFNGKKINTSMDLAEYLLDKKVAVVPGIAFGRDDAFRLSYATSMENIEKGLDRIKDALK